MKVFAVQNAQTNAYTPQFKQNNSQSKIFTKPTANKDTVSFGMARVHIKSADVEALERRLGELAELAEKHLDGRKRQRVEMEQAEINAELERRRPAPKASDNEDVETEDERISRQRLNDLTSDGYRFD